MATLRSIASKQRPPTPNLYQNRKKGASPVETMRKTRKFMGSLHNCTKKSMTANSATSSSNLKIAKMKVSSFRFTMRRRKDNKNKKSSKAKIFHNSSKNHLSRQRKNNLRRHFLKKCLRFRPRYSTSRRAQVRFNTEVQKAARLSSRPCLRK